MQGLMQDWPLTAAKVIDHAARVHPAREIVSRTVEGPIARTTYGNLRTRALKVARVLEGRGIRLGDRVGTLATNTARHMELWYGIMGLGAICHTVNPRLFPDQIEYIVNHAEDRILCFDIVFAPLIEKLAPKLKTVEAFVAMTDSAHLPEARIRNLVAYEDMIGSVDADFAWKALDENTAAGLCYTSGTTGHPKGVLYSHRSNILHAMGVAFADVLGITNADCALAIVPMCHANAWALPFLCPMVGAKMVLPGAKLDGPSICELITTEKVTMSAGVPTVWSAMLAHLEKTGQPRPPSLQRITIGGSAAPRSMIETFERMGVEVRHGWGMTEMSPVGTVCAMHPGMDEAPFDDRVTLKMSQGRPFFGVEMKIVDDAGKEMPHDGKAFGRLLVKGPAIASAYFKAGKPATDDDGWFETGDVATIDAQGYMRITDRAKDVIKSGGEWISSIDIENIAAGHPAVAEAAVIGVRHPKWEERPLLIVVLREGKAATRDDILGALAGKIAKWWTPDDVAFVDEIPHTATGKIQKVALRERFKDYKLPEA
jgi:fatty-acyl-CoA synthase